MLKFLRQLWFMITRREKFQCLGIVLLMIVGAGLEVAGISLLMPLIATVAKPELLIQNKYLRAFHDFLQPSSDRQFVIIVCLIVMALYFGKNLFLLLLTRLQSTFVFNKAQSVSVRLYDRFLNAPYVFHLQHNSVQCLNDICRVAEVAKGMLLPFMLLVSELAVIVAVCLTLLFFAPELSLALVVVAGLGMALVYYPLRSHNYRLGEKVRRSTEMLLKTISESFSGVREITVLNRQPFFSGLHAQYQNQEKTGSRDLYFYWQVPRFFIEAFLVIAAVGALLFFTVCDVATGSILLKFSLLAMALFRLMPSLSRVQYALTQMRQTLSSFERLYDELYAKQPLIPAPAPQTEAAPPFEFRRQIEVENLSFTYPGANCTVFNGFSLIIPCSGSTGLVGATGCGKTTLVDLILGLLTPDCGCVKVDGRNIAENLPSWQRKIGYVPQAVYLLDDTIIANVAFGVPPAEIDRSRVVKALETAQVYTFVAGLTDGLNTVIGEQGVRLSGGQRQRLGIARALYHNPEVLVLDEATSALDSETEQAFVDALEALQGKITIIMIAHRLSTVKNCDQIIDLGK